jgi:hypothetical protein
MPVRRFEDHPLHARDPRLRFTFFAELRYPIRCPCLARSVSAATHGLFPELGVDRLSHSACRPQPPLTLSGRVHTLEDEVWRAGSDDTSQCQADRIEEIAKFGLRSALPSGDSQPEHVG